MEDRNIIRASFQPSPARYDRDHAPVKRRVLVVEDEMLVAMLVEDMVADLGYDVAAVIARLDEALDYVRKFSIDLAVLDVHLNGQVVFPLADALLERHTPFIFATAYGDSGIPVPYRGRPVLQKPFAANQLARALAAIDPGKQPVRKNR